MSDQTALIAATLMQSYGSAALYRMAEYEDVMRRAVDVAVRLQEMAVERKERGERLSQPTIWEREYAAKQEVESALL